MNESGKVTTHISRKTKTTVFVFYKLKLRFVKNKIKTKSIDLINLFLGLISRSVRFLSFFFSPFPSGNTNILNKT